MNRTTNAVVLLHRWYQVDPAILPEPVPYPSIHAPWYGYLFWITAAHGGYGTHANTVFLPAVIGDTEDCSANIKVGNLPTLIFSEKVEEDSAALRCSVPLQECVAHFWPEVCTADTRDALGSKLCCEIVASSARHQRHCQW